MTTYNDMVFQLGGVPCSAPWFLQTGRPIFVAPFSGNDGNDGMSLQYPIKTLTQALALATANNNDVVYMIAESNTAANTTDYQATTLTWNKDAVHLIGLNCGAAQGQRSRIAQLSSVKNINTLFNLTANNCLISNMEIFQGVATSTAVTPVAMNVTGQRNHIINCQIAGIGDTSMDVAAGRSLTLTGAQENLFQHCYIGLDTISRATAAAEVQATLSATRNVFEDCTFPTMAGAAGFLFVKLDTASTNIDRFIKFKNCDFLNAVNSTATTMNAAIAVHASLAGSVVLVGSGVAGATAWAAADTAKIKLLSMDATTSTTNGLIQSLNVA